MDGTLKPTYYNLLKVYLFWRLQCCFKIYIVLSVVSWGVFTTSEVFQVLLLLSLSIAKEIYLSFFNGLLHCKHLETNIPIAHISIHHFNILTRNSLLKKLLSLIIVISSIIIRKWHE